MSDVIKKNMSENLTSAVRDYANVVRAHDTIHPDRMDCGGVGGCLLMRTEHDAATTISNRLDYVIRAEADYTITVEVR